MSKTPENERVAVVEIKINDLHDRFNTHLAAEEEYMRFQRQIMQEIRNEQAKMKGFWGGIVFVFSAIGVAAGIAANHIFSK